MPPLLTNETVPNVLSPRSSNVPTKSTINMKKAAKTAAPQKPEDKPTNPDRIDDKWRPPTSVTEPGENPQTYVTGKKLGKGGFAVCFEGRTQGNSELFALKIVKAKVEQKKMMEKFRTEMQIHAKMQHPNIVQFYRAFTREDHTYVVLEMCNNGSLTEMVRARSCLSLPEVRRYMIQICGGVKYMHKRNIIHRDLKMGNIFIDNQMNLKIGDFGLAAVMADEHDRRTTLCGTPNYIAPEILSKSGTRGHDSKVDTWAVGIICYAMLIGIPPFQSKTQQEIYSKLKTLDYEWKVDSKNYVPEQAKDFVASCLNLVASERPEMDELVEHQFFTMGAIADTLEQNCLKSKPIWLQNSDPRGDKVYTGYGINHSVICAECGVGKTADGRFRPAVGGKANISALFEIEAENLQGCAPTTPLPEGILYRQFTDPESERLAPAKPRSRKPIDETTEALPGIGILSISANLDSVSRTLAAATTRPAQSFAAQQRQQALPQRIKSRPQIREEIQHIQLAEVSEERKTTESTGLLRARPIRAASSRQPRSAQRPDYVRSKSNTISGQLDEVSRQLLKEVNGPKIDMEMKENPEFDVKHTVRGRTRQHQDQLEPVQRPQMFSSKSAEELQHRLQLPKLEDTLKAQKHLSIPPGSFETQGYLTAQHGYDKIRKVQHFKPRTIDEKEPYTTVLGTSYTNIIRSLKDLNAALDPNSVHHSRSDGNSRRVAHNVTTYPRVDKWVDYATKHGIAYILTDGSLGMILKSRDAENVASSCTVVRHARRHTVRRVKGIEQQFVPQGPNVEDVEFYEQIDPAEPMKRLDVPPAAFKLDLDHSSSQTSAANAVLSQLKGAEAQRLKEIGLLDKFGKYMNKQMGSSDCLESSSDEGVGHFIHFYQRLGNVGVWRFADGGLQFNFPDHTKLVVYQSHISLSEIEVMVDVVYLEPRDAKDLAAYGAVTHEALERRGLKTMKLSDILESSLRRSELEIVRSNEILEKLSWVRAVIGCWIKEGGLGHTGSERLGWSGLQERRDDKRIKFQWVTVGRPGGDGEVLPV